MGLLDFIFPKYCVNCRKIGSYLCPNCFSYISFSDGDNCLACGRPSIDGLTHPVCRRRFGIDGSFTSVNYKGVIRKLIYNFKYKPYVTGLKEILGSLFYEGLIQKESFFRIYSKDSVFVPIPLHASKLRKRGYNQSQILAEELSKKFGNKVLNILERVKDTKTQAGLKKDDRKKNISGAFVVKPNVIPSETKDLDKTSIFLVDDIQTTGSTFLEAAKVLKQRGANCVYGFALAKD